MQSNAHHKKIRIVIEYDAIFEEFSEGYLKNVEELKRSIEKYFERLLTKDDIWSKDGNKKVVWIKTHLKKYKLLVEEVPGDE